MSLPRGAIRHTRRQLNRLHSSAKNMDRQTVSLKRQGKFLGRCVKRTISEDCTGVSESERAAGKFQCLQKEARRHSRQPHFSLVTKADAYRHHPLKRAPAPARKHLDERQGTAANNTTTPLIPPQNEQPLLQPPQGQMLRSSSQMNTQLQQVLMAVEQAYGGQILQDLQGIIKLPPKINTTQRYTHLYQQQLLRYTRFHQQRLLGLRQDMACRLMFAVRTTNSVPASSCAGIWRWPRTSCQGLCGRCHAVRPC
ncbi:hypothetical protein BJY01DRAFT_221605 [Aspergillus pseudoustus]|uniref:Uncharacterized protein n=1 Tax=Aspergillus pseudoustus TaxID=1810923 RepID=A0ABR4JAW0_9EURO